VGFFAARFALKSGAGSSGLETIALLNYGSFSHETFLFVKRFFRFLRIIFRPESVSCLAVSAC
jgi:hypothetical protein